MDALAPSRLSTFQPEKAATDAEHRKELKYSELVRSGYIFQSLAFEAQGRCGPKTQTFLKELGHRLRTTTQDKNSNQYLHQRIGVAIQLANTACVLGTVGNPRPLDEIYNLCDFALTRANGLLYPGDNGPCIFCCLSFSFSCFSELIFFDS